VREALVTSALLQLPFSMPMREKLDRVEGIITELVSAGVPGPTLQVDTHMLRSQPAGDQLLRRAPEHLLRVRASHPQRAS